MRKMRTLFGFVHCCCCCFLLLLPPPLWVSLAAAKQLLRYRLAEEGPADIRIGNVASDLGIVTGSGEVTFSLESGSDYLKIDNMTGELSTTERRIDREKLPQCQMIFDENECFLDFEVSVIGPSQSWVDLFEGRVIILDINDNTPTFPSPVLTLTVEENRPSVRRLLRLDETSGWLSVLHRIDREEVNQLRFTVMARDRGQPPKTDKATVVLNIRDENDNVPTIDIRKIGRIPLRDGVASVAEDVLVDTPIALVQVSDRDQGENGVVTCTVVGDVPFQLKPASEGEGEPQNKRKYFLHTSAPLDYEAVREYNVVIVAVDSGSPSLSSNNSLLVRVADTNDNPPVFGQAVLEVSFPENNSPGERVATVVATDADSGKNAEIFYSLEPSPLSSEAPGGIFSIDPDSGDVLVQAVLDREQRDTYEFQVTARDKGAPALQGSTTVVVRVADRNDNEPRFMQDVFTFYVKENLQPNSPVGMVTVMDSDRGRNAELSLSIQPGEQDQAAGIFSIENDTGTIYSTISFDREQQTSYTFKVKALDGGEPPRSATATVNLFVMDENDNPPAVTFPSNSSYTVLPPSSNLRTVVATVLATDADTGLNADLNFSIVGGNPFKLFEIDPASGVVSLVGKLAPKHYGLHRLVVQVNDSGQPPQSTTALLHVFVNESLSNATVVESQVARSLHTPLAQDIAGDPSYELSKQRLSIVIGVVAGIMTVILLILVVVMARYCRSKGKHGYEAGKKDHEDFFTPQQHDKAKKPKKDKKGKKGKQPLYSSIVTVEASKPNGQRYDSVNEKLSDSPSMGRYRSVNGGPGSPDLARHYKSSSPLPTVQLHPQSPTAGKKHQAVQELPPANTFVGAGDNISIGSDHCSEYSCQASSKYSKQATYKYQKSKTTFSTKAPVQQGI
ncbi:Protocadherin-7 [Chelonia mydas]|uniref:Protocadherin-7 n=1 Tax=Chelonia mydas TaxID=8469 RepID=M7AS55_CHEMY|nr:Protocadherin-7 [Chelonia mydas]